eukprot:TRINITY_DN35928_c0_g1_i1.p1 TRINITY_DN35928_c0_g1~~TRINITY_DN35928_c0_g1_i1.p1  ORF type:complete len:1365 (+),score=289.56 TRINITY_DN35928_c0_g1_i1:55-4149(+)
MNLKTARLPKGLRGIVDALEQSNVTLALKRSGDFLERYPSSLIGRALRALVLESSGSQRDALMLCSDVRRAKPVDPQVLSAVQQVYIRCQLPGEASAVYEEATTEDPNNESLLVSLFLALVFEGNTFHRQQKVALKLYKGWKRTEYMHWSAMAIMLQAAKAGPHRSLDLSEALLQRSPPSGRKRLPAEEFTADSRLDQFSLLLFHLAALRQQGKYQQALDLLDTYGSEAPLEEDALQLRLTLHAEAGHALQAVEAARTKFLSCVEDWASAKEYITAAFMADGCLCLQSQAQEAEPRMSPGLGAGSAALDFAGRVGGAVATSAGEELAEMQGDGTTEEIVEAGQCVKDAYVTIKRLQAKEQELQQNQDSIAECRKPHFYVRHSTTCSRNGKVRALYMAELEIRALCFASSELEALRQQEASAARRQQAQARAAVTWPLPELASDMNEFVELLILYFKRFGHLRCCIFDLKPYVSILRDDQVVKFMQGLADVEASPEEEFIRWSGEDPDDSGVHRLHQCMNVAKFRHSLHAFSGKEAANRLVQEAMDLSSTWLKLKAQTQASMTLSPSDSDLWSAAAPAASMPGTVVTRQPHHMMLRRAGVCHGLMEELYTDIDDMLCLAALHLIDLDRLFCEGKMSKDRGPDVDRNIARLTLKEIVIDETHALPCLRDRHHILDALTLLELGTKITPSSARMRLLLAVIYGALGAATTMKKWCEALTSSSPQGRPLAGFALDRLVAHGAWNEALDVCTRIHQAKRDFELATRMALVSACQETARSRNAGHGLQRTSEYTAALETACAKLHCGHSVIEEAAIRLLSAKTVDEVSEYLLTVSRPLELAAETSPPDGAQNAQDLATFRWIQQLPRCTPMQAVVLGSIGARHVLCPQARRTPAHLQWSSAFGQEPLVRGCSSSKAAAWPAAGKPCSEMPDIPGLEEVEERPAGVFETMMAQRRLSSFGVLQIRAQLLLIAHAILRERPSEAKLADLMRGLQVKLAKENVAMHCDPETSNLGCVPECDSPRSPYSPISPTGAASRTPSLMASHYRTLGSGILPDHEVEAPEDMTEEDPMRGLAPPWRAQPTSAEELFWRCTFLACDAAHRMMQALGKAEFPDRKHVDVKTDSKLLDQFLLPAMNSSTAWNSLRRLLQVLKPVIRSCIRTILTEPTPPAGVKEAAKNSLEAEAMRRGGPFTLGGFGLQLLTSFLQGPMLVIVPMIHFLVSQTGPASSNYAVSQAAQVVSHLGSSMLIQIRGFDRVRAPTDQEKEAVRQALADVSEDLQSELKELCAALMGAQWQGVDHCGRPEADAEPGSTVPTSVLERLGQQGIDLEKYRKIAMSSLESSHRKQLANMEKVVRGQISLLASIQVRSPAVT